MFREIRITPYDVAMNTLQALEEKNALEDTAFIRQMQGGYDGSHSFYLPKLHPDPDRSISDQVEAYKNLMLWKYIIGFGAAGAIAVGALKLISKVLSQPH